MKRGIYKNTNLTKIVKECAICGKRDKVTDGKKDGKWVKMCQTCFLSSI